MSDVKVMLLLIIHQEIHEVSFKCVLKRARVISLQQIYYTIHRPQEGNS